MESVTHPVDKTCVEHGSNTVIPTISVAASVCRGDEAHGEEEEDHL